MGRGIDRETAVVYGLTTLYLVLYPLFFGSSFFVLPLVPAAFVVNKIKERYRYVQVFFLGFLGDAFFSPFSFGWFTVLLLMSCLCLRWIQKFLYIHSFFSLSVFVFILSVIFHGMEMITIFFLTEADCIGCLFRKELLFSPLKQALFALFAYTLPMLTLMPKQVKSPKILSFKRF